MAGNRLTGESATADSLASSLREHRDDGLNLPLRLRRAGRGLAYMLISVPLGLISAVGVLVAAIGAALSVVWIGVPVFSGAIAACRWTVGRDRRAANALLGAHIPPSRSGATRATGPPAPGSTCWPTGSSRACSRCARSSSPWRSPCWCWRRSPSARRPACSTSASTGSRGLGDPIYLGPVETSFGGGLLMCLFAVPVAVLTVAALGTGGTILRALSRSLLLSPPSAGAGPCGRCSPRASATARCRSPTGCPTARSSSTRRAGR